MSPFLDTEMLITSHAVSAALLALVKPLPLPKATATEEWPHAFASKRKNGL